MATDINDLVSIEAIVNEEIFSILESDDLGYMLYQVCTIIVAMEKCFENLQKGDPYAEYRLSLYKEVVQACKNKVMEMRRKHESKRPTKIPRKH